jgi:hypothetical protein
MGCGQDYLQCVLGVHWPGRICHVVKSLEVAPIDEAQRCTDYTEPGVVRTAEQKVRTCFVSAWCFPDGQNVSRPPIGVFCTRARGPRSKNNLCRCSILSWNTCIQKSTQALASELEVAHFGLATRVGIRGGASEAQQFGLSMLPRRVSQLLCEEIGRSWAKAAILSMPPANSIKVVHCSEKSTVLFVIRPVPQVHPEGCAPIKCICYHAVDLTCQEAINSPQRRP